MGIPVEARNSPSTERRSPVVRVLDQEGLRFDLVRRFRLIVWDDTGRDGEGITTNDAALLRQAWRAGIPGERVRVRGTFHCFEAATPSFL